MLVGAEEWETVADEAHPPDLADADEPELTPTSNDSILTFEQHQGRVASRECCCCAAC